MYIGIWASSPLPWHTGTGRKSGGPASCPHGTFLSTVETDVKQLVTDLNVSSHMWRGSQGVKESAEEVGSREGWEYYESQRSTLGRSGLWAEFRKVQATQGDGLCTDPSPPAHPLCSGLTDPCGASARTFLPLQELRTQKSTWTGQSAMRAVVPWEVLNIANQKWFMSTSISFNF